MATEIDRADPSGIVLLGATVVAVAPANAPRGASYRSLFDGGCAIG